MMRRGMTAAVLAAAGLGMIAAPAAASEKEADRPVAKKKPAPPNTLTAAEKKAGFVLLFDGKSLKDWKVGDNPKTFQVADGKIVVNGPRAHAFYAGPVANHTFKSFELRARVLVHPKSNSGIYIHTRYQEKGWPGQGYECQVCSDQFGDPRKTGSIYRRSDVKKSPVKDGEWFDYHIVVRGRKITTILNGKKAAEYTDPADPGQRRLKGGTIALQGHDPKSRVEYHTIRIRPLPEKDEKKPE